MLEKIRETALFIEEKISYRPKIAIILGSGLGELIHHITDTEVLSYEEIPNFPISTVEGHSGKLIFGMFAGKQIMAMQGRFHFYEGYDMKDVTFPIRVMKALGIEILFLSNAAGGMNPTFKVGDVMIIKDHINLFPEHPLRGKNYKELGTRFPDMHEPYSTRLINLAKQIALSNNIDLKEGVYVGTQGPTFETPAEYKYFHTIGGDTVGMSTVPEVIVAKHAGIETFALSVVTDMWFENSPIEVSHEEVLEAANNAQPIMTLVMSEIVKSL